MQQSRVYVGMILILIFGEVLGLYGYVFLTQIFANLVLTKCQLDRWFNPELEVLSKRRVTTPSCVIQLSPQLQSSTPTVFRVRRLLSPIIPGKTHNPRHKPKWIKA